MSDQTNVNVNVTEKDEQHDPSTKENDSHATENDSHATESDKTTPDTPQNSENANHDKIDLLTIDVKDDNTALNVIIGFLGIAQRRGIFAINESAKIFECIQQFQRQR